MTTEAFTRQDFENSLKSTMLDLTGNGDFEHRGVIAGEYRYHLLVTSNVKCGKIIIEVASSIGYSDVADPAGQNSIRLWLSDGGGMPLGSKISRWVTRMSGWEKRMDDQIKRLFSMGKSLKFCDSCNSLQHVFIVKKDGANKGRLFKHCKCAGDFHWLADERDQEEPAKTVIEGMNHKPLGNGKTVLQNAYKKVQEQKAAEPTKKAFTPSKYQRAIFDWIQADKGKHLVVEALAGSGKTTTGVEALKLIPMTQSVVFVAFNKHIAVELQRRLEDQPHIKVSTYHSLGYAAVRQAFGNVQMDEDKVNHILDTILDRYMYRPIFPVIRQLVSLVKANLTGTTDEDLTGLAEHYGIELNGDSDTVFTAVALVIEKSAKMTNVIDYDDMVYLPVKLDLPMKQYDFLFADEFQDTSKVQIELAMKSVKKNGRIVALGDRFQSLYGFRGASVDSIPNLIRDLQADVLPLSITYRCPKCIVEMVKQKFPMIPLEAPEWAKDGEMRHITANIADTEYTPGDMVLCRTNAPLVEPAFSLIRRGIKAIIRGRDIGKGLTVLVRKMKANDMGDLMSKLVEYKSVEVSKLLNAEKGSQAQSLTDKVDTIVALADGTSSITELEIRIEDIFSDENEGVVFSSVHRAKGLEAQRVYILRADLMPHSMAKKDWELQQESNIQYVAYTRTLETLTFVE